jgi:electron-transferring-flavoprotein dehydrogenase
VPLEFVPVPQVETELYRERNIRPSFGLGGGLYGGLAYSALEAYLLRGRAPWTLRHRCVL